MAEPQRPTGCNDWCGPGSHHLWPCDKAVPKVQTAGEQRG